jgi:integrase
MPVRKRKGYERYEIDFRWTHPLTGERKRYRRLSPHTSKRKARKLEKKLHSQYEDPHYWRERARRENESTAQCPTLNDFSERFLRDYVDSKLKHSTGVSYRIRLEKHILPALGEMRIDEITKSDIDKFSALLLRPTDHEENPGKGHSRKTVRNVLGVLSRALKCAVDWKLIPQIPTIDLPKAGQPKWYYLERNESTALVRHAEPKIKMMVYLALQTGMRLGELLGLRPEDCDLQRLEIHIRRSYTHGKISTPKNHRLRAIPITQECGRRLQAHLDGCDGSKYVFSDENGILNKQKVRDPLVRAYEAAGIHDHKRGWHILRHTYATQMAGSGAVTLRDLQRLLGHHSIEQTERYAHFLPESSIRAREAMTEIRLGEGAFDPD